MSESGPAASATAVAPGDAPEFAPQASRPRLLLLGEGAGMAVVVELALRLAAASPAVWMPLALLGAPGPFPFRPRPSTLLVPGMPPGVIACLPRLDALSIPSRLASAGDLPGCFPGTVVELAALWLAALCAEKLAQTALCASGPGNLAAAAQALAARCDLPCAVLPCRPPDKPLSRS